MSERIVLDDELIERALIARSGSDRDDELLGRILTEAARRPRSVSAVRTRRLTGMRLAWTALILAAVLGGVLLWGVLSRRPTPTDPILRLTGIDWRLVEVTPSVGLQKEASLVTTPGFDARLRFGTNGTVAAVTPCGTSTASYSGDDTTISLATLDPHPVPSGSGQDYVSVGGWTSIPGIPPAPATDGCNVMRLVYLQMLTTTNVWRMDGNELVLGAPPGGVGVYRP